MFFATFTFILRKHELLSQTSGTTLGLQKNTSRQTLLGEHHELSDKTDKLRAAASVLLLLLDSTLDGESMFRRFSEAFSRNLSSSGLEHRQWLKKHRKTTKNRQKQVYTVGRKSCTVAIKHILF